MKKSVDPDLMAVDLEAWADQLRKTAGSAAVFLGRLGSAVADLREDLERILANYRQQHGVETDEPREPDEGHRP